MLLNIADMRTVHSREALASLHERFGEKLFDTVIRSSIAYAESAERATSILDHRPDLGADYLALADEVLARLRGRGAPAGGSPQLTFDSAKLPHVRALRPRTARRSSVAQPSTSARSASTTAPVCS